MGAFHRFIVEYVGNLHLPSREDRRTNRQARDLIDWIKRQMEARGFEAAEKRELVNDLRRASGPAARPGRSDRDGRHERARCTL